MKELEPNSNGYALPLPPWNSTPSIEPTKSITAISPFLVALSSSTFAESRRESVIYLTAFSISSAGTLATYLFKVILEKSPTLISGKTSTSTVNSTSLPSSNFSILISGVTAGRNLLLAITSLTASRIISSRTSPKTLGRYCLSIIAFGA